MKASKWFAGMKDGELQDWEAQYGRGLYRGVPRKACMAEMNKRGLRPLTMPHTVRPRGYDESDPFRVWKGYMFNGGLQVA